MDQSTLFGKSENNTVRDNRAKLLRARTILHYDNNYGVHFSRYPKHNTNIPFVKIPSSFCKDSF